MTDLRCTPSVQHAVTLICGTVEETVAEMEKLDGRIIPFSLNPARRLMKPLMEGFPLDWAIRQIKADPHKKNIAPNIGLITAFAPYAEQKTIPWFRECPTGIYYPIGNGIVIPVNPTGFWHQNGKFRVLWPQCWKGRNLTKKQRAIFNTILRESFFVGDFKNADLEWVDLSEKVPKQGRSLEVLPGESLGSVDKTELAFYMDTLTKAYEIYQAKKPARKAGEKRKKKDDNNPSLFDDPDTPPPL